MLEDVLIPVVAILTIFGGGTLVLFSITPVGKALAARILGKKGVATGVEEETAEEVMELRREVDGMRHLGEQMSELGERVDFLERMVAKQRDAERLPPVRYRMPPEGVAFLFTLTIIGSTVLLFPLVRALAERIRSKNVDAGVRDELQVLREDLLAEIQQARREIGDLGERVDFTERLLAKKSQT